MCECSKGNCLSELLYRPQPVVQTPAMGKQRTGTADRAAGNRHTQASDDECMCADPHEPALGVCGGADGAGSCRRSKASTVDGGSRLDGRQSTRRVLLFEEPRASAYSGGSWRPGAGAYAPAA
jgi:hypothetical protein